MKIRFAISSHLDFHTSTLPILVPSLIKCGVPPCDIIVAIAGCRRKRASRKLYGVKCDFVTHNSFDLTGLINVIERGYRSDYWFLMHDTCFAGPDFYNLVRRIPENLPDSVALKREFSMNMGAYSQKYLRRIKAELLSCRNSSLDPASIQKCKQWAVEHEDIFLHPIRHVYGNDEPVITTGVSVYRTGTPRNIEYYRQLDLHKVKANWHAKAVYSVRL